MLTLFRRWHNKCGRLDSSLPLSFIFGITAFKQPPLSNAHTLSYRVVACPRR